MTQKSQFTSLEEIIKVTKFSKVQRQVYNILLSENYSSIPSQVMWRVRLWACIPNEILYYIIHDSLIFLVELGSAVMMAELKIQTVKIGRPPSAVRRSPSAATATARRSVERGPSSAGHCQAAHVEAGWSTFGLTRLIPPGIKCINRLRPNYATNT